MLSSSNLKWLTFHEPLNHDDEVQYFGILMHYNNIYLSRLIDLMSRDDYKSWQQATLRNVSSCAMPSGLIWRKLCHTACS